MKKKMLAMLIAGVIIMGGGVNSVKADEVVSENTYIETEEQAKEDVKTNSTDSQEEKNSSEVSNEKEVTEDEQIKNSEVNSKIAIMASNETIKEVNTDDKNNNVESLKAKASIDGKNETGNVEINEKNFPDEVFRNYVINELNGGSTVLTPEKINSITEISLDNTKVGESNKRISNLKGIEYFKNLKILNCGYISLKDLDVSKNINLEELSCGGNNITSLDISNNIKLKKLYCSENKLEYLDVSKNTELEEISCVECNLKSLDVSNNKKLELLYCGENYLTELDLTNNTELSVLDCGDDWAAPFYDSEWSGKNEIETLDLSNNKKLSSHSCVESGIKNLDLTNNPFLYWLMCSGNKIETLDLTQNKELTSLYCSGNKLTYLDISNNNKLSSLNCSDNKITTINLNNKPDLKFLYCTKNKLTSLDCSDNLSLGMYNYDAKDNMSNINSEEKNGEYYIDLHTLNDPNMDYKRVLDVRGVTESGEEKALEYDLETGIIKSSEKLVKVKYKYDAKNAVMANIEFTLIVDKVNVTFDTKFFNLSNPIQDEILDIGSKVTEPEKLQAEGYNFNGWYKDWDCTEKWNFETDTVTENTTLYAGWTSIEENTGDKEDNKQEENTGDKEDNKQEENAGDKEDNKQEENTGDKEDNKQEENKENNTTGDKNNNNIEDNNNTQNNGDTSSKDNNQSNKENTSTIDKNQNNSSKSENVSNTNSKDKNTGVVKTGDKSLIGILVGLMLGAFGIIIGLFERKERE